MSARPLRRALPQLCLLVLSVAACAAAQAEHVIYRCTDASGAITFQNDTPCPAGTQQQRRVVEIAPPMPAFTPQPRVETPPSVPLLSSLQLPEVLVGTAVQETDTPPRESPPALLACKAHDDSIAYREDATPVTRCLPLQTIGIGSLPGMGAGQACERVEDVCSAVPDEALCRTWDTRVREAEFRWKFAQGRERDALRGEYETLFRTYADSNCLQ